MERAKTKNFVNLRTCLCKKPQVNDNYAPLIYRTWMFNKSCYKALSTPNFDIFFRSFMQNQCSIVFLQMQQNSTSFFYHLLTVIFLQLNTIFCKYLPNCRCYHYLTPIFGVSCCISNQVNICTTDQKKKKNICNQENFQKNDVSIILLALNCYQISCNSFKKKSLREKYLIDRFSGFSVNTFGTADVNLHFLNTKNSVYL